MHSRFIAILFFFFPPFFFSFILVVGWSHSITFRHDLTRNQVRYKNDFQEQNFGNCFTCYILSFVLYVCTLISRFVHVVSILCNFMHTKMFIDFVIVPTVFLRQLNVPFLGKRQDSYPNFITRILLFYYSNYQGSILILG